MATLKPVILDIGNDCGQREKFTCPLSVTNDGEFSMGIPIELWDIVYAHLQNNQSALSARGISWTTIGCGEAAKQRLRCKRQDELTKFMTECANTFLAVDIVETDVIIYLADTQYNFVIAGGSPFTNGHHAEAAGFSDHTQRNWVKSEARNARNVFDREFPTGVMVAVDVFKKETITRGTTTAYRYSNKRDMRHNETSMQCLANVGGLSSETINKKGCGVNGNMNTRNEIIENSPYSELPLTEENALFFYTMITNLQMMAHKFNTFFVDSQKVQAAIANQVAATMIGFAGSNDSE